MAMQMKMKIIKFVLMLMFVSFSRAQSHTFLITNEVAPNGDITQALRNAWQEACASTIPSKIVVSRGTYMLKQTEFRGPCMAPIEVEVDGVIMAPPDPHQFDGTAQWVKFTYLNFFTFSGTGTFDGQGTMAWTQNDCNVNQHCEGLSMNFGFGFLNNTIIRGIRSKDSKNAHINVLGCNNITFTDLNIVAPGSSPNTDGIHIARSVQVNVTHTRIATGDDCISLGDGSSHINVLNVTCGPGHGISVGSLGKYTYEKPIVGFTVKNCTLINADNGVRIKTWPNTPGNITVSSLRFEDINMINVRNPIIIDQEYCPWNQCTGQNPSKVQISMVVFKNILGTSATEEGVTLMCSSGVPCEYIVFDNVYLTFKGLLAAARLVNVRHIFLGRVPPLMKWLMAKP